MQEFKNGDQVLIAAGNKWVYAEYIGVHRRGQHRSNGHVVFCDGEFIRRVDTQIKPKPATININGVEVSRPLIKEDADDCRVTAEPVTLFFRSYHEAATFMNAIDGIKEGNSNE